MERLVEPQDQDLEKGQVTIWRCLYGYVDTMALKCAVKLGVADIINSYGGPISLTQIANTIGHPSLDPNRLKRVMTLLVRRGIFSASPSSMGGKLDTLYGLTDSSKWLLRESERSLAPFVIAQSQPEALSAWHHLDNCVKEGCTGFKKCYGMDAWKFTSANPEESMVLQDGLASVSKITMEALRMAYFRQGFEGFRSLVDVGGGNGALMSEIVKGFPHIKGINFDLPHVIADAPDYVGVNQVAGDMFNSVPQADGIILKFVLHNWNEENCIKILKNCRKAIPEETGKIIIIDAVLEPQGKDLFDDTAVALDLLMMVLHGSKERTEAEWKALLEEGGFPHYKIIKLPALASVIEAYPRISSSINKLWA